MRLKLWKEKKEVGVSVNVLKLACRKVALARRIEGSRKRLYRMALAWCHDTMLADDLVQDALMLALQKLHQLKDEEAFDGWIYTILNNVWLTYLRKARPSEDIDQVVVADSASPEHELLMQQVDFMVRSAMASLPNAQRQVVSLVDLEGLSYAEVAEILQVPIGTVMSRLNRARSALGKVISQKRKLQQNRAVETGHRETSKLRVVK